MENRMDKYKDTDTEINIENFSRSQKNESLYKEIYGNYSDLENLPIYNNTNEIDIENLKSLVDSRNTRYKDKIKEQVLNEEYEIDNTSDNNDEKSYDIKELLEKAREENIKVKEEKIVNKTIPNYLVNLESDKNNQDIIIKYNGDEDDDMPIINEISSKEEIIGNVNTTALSLDILSDLKPNSDTLVTEPLVKDETKDMDFYSGNINFKKDDFEESDDDFFDKPKNYVFLKVLLLIIGFGAFAIGLYFIVKEFIV